MKNILIFLFFLVISTKQAKTDIYGINNNGTKIILKKGDYTFHVYGAQGGAAYINGYIATTDGIGGKGAYIKAHYHTTSSQTFTLIIGEKGSSSENGPNPGGLPDGGAGGKDTGGLVGNGNDASGGGGASSKILLGNSIVIVAGGGSGGAYRANGCNGGDFRLVYCAVSDNQCESYQDIYKGISTGIGGNGADHTNIPGSGGGGGYYGGNTTGTGAMNLFYTAVACSGSSYYDWSIIENAEYLNNPRIGDGVINITTNYLCMDECADCESNDKCTKCSGSKGLYNGRCVNQCPSGQTVNNNVCEKCTSNCGECAYNKINQCTKCYDPFSLYGTACLNMCPTHYYSKSNVCEECSASCAECSGSDSTCTKCHDGQYLYNGICYSDKCPIGSFLSDSEILICSSCDSSCETCSSAQKCDTCRQGEHIDFTTGLCISNCKSHYYQDELGQCNECDSTCLECYRTPTTCRNESQFPILYKNKCISRRTYQYAKMRGKSYFLYF